MPKITIAHGPTDADTPDVDQVEPDGQGERPADTSTESEADDAAPDSGSGSDAAERTDQDDQDPGGPFSD